MAEGTGAAPQGGFPQGPTEYTPPAFPWLHRLQFRVAALVFLAVLPLVVLLIYDHVSARDAAILAAGREAGLAARIAANNQSEALTRPQAILETVARDAVVREGKPEACRTLLADLLPRSPGFRDFRLVAPDGTAIASALPAEASAALGDPAGVARARKTGRTEVGSFRADGEGGVLVSIACPVGSGDASPGAVLGGTVDLSWLAQYQRVLGLPGDSSLEVLEPEGTTLLRVTDAGAATASGKHPAFQALLANVGGEKAVVATGADGMRRFYGMAPLVTGGSRQGFMVVVGFPEERFAGNLDRSLRINLIVTVAALLLTLGVAHVLGERWVLRRVNGLILATRRLATTDLSKLKARTRVCQDPSELGDLERSFDEMAKALEKHARELEARGK